MENKHTQYVDFSNPNADKITTRVTNKPMINKKQTAVEWLMDRLPHSIETQFSKQIEQAKEIEKKQLIDAYSNNGWNDEDQRANAEQYYNETYKKTI